MAQVEFHFRQFSIRQEKSLLKVCTDACVFGAWTVDQLKQEGTFHPVAGLDIGTGTGLLSLQLVQELQVQMDAIEIDQGSAEEAAENFDSSLWREQLRVYHQDARTFVPDRQYQLMVSNPPFFDDDLLPKHAGRRMAKHESGMGLEWLLAACSQWLETGGYLSLLLPADRNTSAVELAGKEGLTLHRMAWLKQTGQHAPFRCLLLFRKGIVATVMPEAETIVIRENGFYSDRFDALMAPFYLPLYHERFRKK
ncbi:tRNA1(Val) (adenine(37)-N6)-methyltransferase [Flavihumibacter petaseus]|uniref:Putative tRNA methyltransferase n=1 Tax=Flavihumibacter petaseus NBRC 106054 TaxID=1220578 RepID=A0A0E9N265_9BACT|nr:methyltransferase [Flavihumibacter petaseus]GAO43919.1 putative tRNA methyltransferase [Flavihumibacter petaseus NBRC 106054]